MAEPLFSGDSFHTTAFSLVTPALRITLFGQLSISYQGTVITAVKSERLQALLAFLLLHRSAPQSRQGIAVTLWPDSIDANAKSNLRKRLHELKKQIPDSDRYLSVRQQTVQWMETEDCWIDVAAFEAAIVQANAQLEAQPEQAISSLEAALKLYQGDVLPSCYDDWIVPLRDRLRQQTIFALDTVIPLLAKQSRLKEAISYAQQLQRMDALYEPAYLHLMRLHAQSGARAIALRTYHQCMTLLREELGVDPSAETREFHEILLRGETIPADSAPVDSALADSAPVDSASEQPAPPAAESVVAPIGNSIAEPTGKAAVNSVVNSASNLSASAATASVDWGEAPDVSFFCGRKEESDRLRKWILTDRAQLIAVLGMGGIGKTSLVAKIAHDLQADFEYVVWRSLRNAPPLNTLLGELVPFLSQQQESDCSVPRLIYWLRQSRCLVVLDNLETLLKSGERAGQFQEKHENYGVLLQLLGQTNHQSCIILTSREKPTAISTFEGGSRALQSLQLAGSPEASLALLEVSNLAGSQAQKELLGKRYGHNPLALQIVSGSIRDLFEGEISLFLEEDTLLFNGAKKLLDLQFERLSPLEKTVMYWLAINREWTSIAELAADIYPYCSKRKLLEALESLRWRSLIERKANTYTQQPVVMEYVITVLLNEMTQELSNPNFSNPNPSNSDSLKVSANKNNDGQNHSNTQHLCDYALMKTTVEDYIRESQQRVIMQPLIEELRSCSRRPQDLILQHLQMAELTKADNYYVGNLLNLGRLLNADFTGLDLSGTFVRQAYLQDVQLRQVSFVGANFQQTTFTQPAGPIFDVVFNHDGSLMAACEGGGRLVVWCTETYKPKLTLQDTSNWLLSVSFNHDGSRIISEGKDHQLVVWDTITGECVQRLTGHSADVWDINPHPTENFMVSASADGTACIWDLSTGKLRHQLSHPSTESPCPVRAAAFSPNGERMASGSEDGSLSVWDTKTGEPLHNWQRPASIMTLSFSLNGQQLALGYHTGDIELWDMTTESVVRAFSAHKSPVMALEFSPCGRYLASGSYRASKLWAAHTGELLRAANNYGSWIWGLAFSPNGQYLAVGNHDHTVRLWELPKKRLLKSLTGVSSWITAAKFHPEKSLVASCSNDGTVRLWDVANEDVEDEDVDVKGDAIDNDIDSNKARTQTVLTGHQDWVVGVDFSPCGQYLATSSHDQTIKLWAVNTGKLLKTFSGHVNAVYGIQFTPDGQRLVSSGLDLTLRIWDVATGKVLKILEPPEAESQHGWILAIRFSPNQQYFATAGSDAVINFWDAKTGKHQKGWQAHTAPLWAISFHPSESQLVSVGEDTTVKVWHTKNGELLKTLEAHTDSIYAAEYSPDGKWLVTAGDDLAIKLWDAKTYTLIKSLEHHQGRVSTLSFSSDSRYLASGSIDETIAIWDVSADQPLLSLRAPRPYEGMDIAGAQGLTEAQKAALIALGALA